MSKSFFSIKRDSDEDYLTQIFAWILENIDGIANQYVSFLCKKASIPYKPNKTKITISTQVTVPSGRIDLLIRTDNNLAFICEHKIDSELSKNQIQKYMDYSDNLGPEKYYSVLLTRYRKQHTQRADVNIIWSDIYELIENILNSYNAENAPVNTFILNQFLNYLSDKGMRKAELIQADDLMGYMKLKKSLENIFDQLAKADFSTLCSGIEKIGTAFSPELNKTYNYGRLGIDMFKKWDMGLFAGVILDPKDHKIPPLDPNKGPDLVVLLESKYEEREKDKEKYEKWKKNYYSDKVGRLRTLLEQDSGCYNFIPWPENKCRIAVLRIPLYDVIYRKYSEEEQINAIGDAIVKMINMMLNAMQ